MTAVRYFLVFAILISSLFISAQRIDSLFIFPNSVSIEIYHNYTTDYVNHSFFVSNDTCYLQVCYEDGMGAAITYDSTNIPVSFPTNTGSYTLKLVTSLTHSVGVCDNYALFDSVMVDFSIPMTKPIVLSSNKFEDKLELDVYPNPIQNKLNVNFEGEIKQIDIISVNGSLVQSFLCPQKEIELEVLEKGFYFVQVHTEKGTAMRKIVKQ